MAVSRAQAVSQKTRKQSASKTTKKAAAASRSASKGRAKASVKDAKKAAAAKSSNKRSAMPSKNAKTVAKAAGSKSSASKAPAAKVVAKTAAKPSVAKTPAAKVPASKPAAVVKPVATAPKAAVKPAAPRVEEKKPLTQRQGFKTNEFVVYPAHGVGVAQGRCERLFEEDVAAGFRGGGDHCNAIRQPSRTDSDEVRLFLCEHLAVVGIEARGAGALAGCGEPGGIIVGEGDYFEALCVAKSGIHPVPVAAAGRGADDADAIVLGHDACPW